MTSTTRFAVTLGFAVAFASAATVCVAGDTPSAATFVGDQACLECHGEVAKTLAGTPHGQAGFAKLSAHGCEACHGPGSLHIDDPENVSMRLTDKTAHQQNQVCQTCHGGGKQFLWVGSVHDTRGLSCLTCHSVHAAKSESQQLKAASAMEVCFQCHKEVRADLWKNSHHPIREGRISCMDCHNPHGTETAKMISAASVNDLCYTCHTEKRGPFLWEHAPVRESCLNCHVSHGSNHIKLQRTSVPYICQECHSNTRHPGTLYDATTLADAARASNRIFNRACLDCHASIHGSNNPSSPYLGH
ncbi:MAG: DmsE family decaheme c-type cytochrome [Thermoanaerobaculia bacterium]